MKKSIIAVVLAVVVGAAAAGGYYAYDKGILKFPNTLHVKEGHGHIKIVRIPINNGTLEVYIDGENELEWTNELNTWKFTNSSVMLTSTPLNGWQHEGDVWANHDCVYREFGDTYVTVRDSSNILQDAIDSLRDGVVREEFPELLKDNKIKKPKYSTPEDCYVTDNDIIVRSDYTTVSIASKYKENNVLDYEDDVISYTTDDGYLNAFVTYGDFKSIRDVELTRLTTLTGVSEPTWYSKDGKFYAYIGDRYVGVRSVNSNTYVVIEAKGASNQDYVLSTVFGMK